MDITQNLSNIDSANDDAAGSAAESATIGTGARLAELAPVQIINFNDTDNRNSVVNERPRRTCALYPSRVQAGPTQTINNLDIQSNTSRVQAGPTQTTTNQFSRSNLNLSQAPAGPLPVTINNQFSNCNLSYFISSQAPAGPLPATIDLNSSQPNVLLDNISQAFSQSSMAKHRLVIEDDALVFEYHGPNKQILCHCSKTFGGIYGLKKHLANCTSSEAKGRNIDGYKCYLCEDSRPSMAEMFKHYSKEHPEQRTSSSSSAALDSSADGQPSSFNCSYCQATFPSISGLGQHKRHRHSDRLHEETPPTKRPRWTEAENQVAAEAEAITRKAMNIDDMAPRAGNQAFNDAVYANILTLQPDFRRSLAAVVGKRTHGDVAAFSELVRTKRARLLSEDNVDSTPSYTSASLECNNGAEGRSSTDPINGPCDCLAEVERAINAHLEKIAVDRSAVNAFLVAVRAGLDNYNVEELKRAFYTRSSSQSGTQSSAITSSSSKDSCFTQQRGEKAREKVRQRAHVRRIFETQGHKRCLQHLQNPTKAGKCTRETVELFKDVFENSGSIDEAPYKAKATRFDPHLTHKAIVPSEVEAQLARLPKATAPGVDGIRTGDLAAIKTEDLACLFNIFLVHKDVPKALKVNRTTLIPKSANPGPGDWRPITISSVIDRLFAKILEARLSKVVDLNATQRGFIRGLDGCGENITAYSGLIHYARAKAKSLVIVSLDLAKAFDSVKYSSIQRALARMGLNTTSIELLMNLCHGHTTELQFDEGSVSVELKKGVRQGWPLSPLLFLIVVDELLCSLDESNGFNVISDAFEAISITGNAFADDLILYSSCELGMKRSIQATVDWCDARGMKINANKSSATWLRAIGKRRKVVVHPIEMPVKGVNIPNVEDSYERILGVHIHNSGRVDLKLDKFKADLELVRKSMLRPNQKALMITQCLIPMIKYRLVYGSATKAACNEIDLLVRSALKSILHLPKYTQDLAFYVGKADGGLGVPKLIDSVVLSQFKLTSRMLNSPHNSTRILADKSAIAKAEHLFSRFLNGSSMTEELVEVIKEKLREERFNEFSESAQGAGIAMYKSAPRMFLDNPTSRGWTDHQMINALRLRYDLLPTRDVAKRTYARLSHIVDTCRGCHGASERIGHVIGHCSSTQTDRVARHDNLRNYISERLNILLRLQTRNNGEFEVKKEFEITLTPEEAGRERSQRLRPDLAVILPDQIVLIEVSVVFESTFRSQNSLEQVRKEKCQKYHLLPKVLTQRTGKRCNLKTLIVGCRGGWLKSNDSLFNNLGLVLSERDKNSLVERAVRGSLIVWKNFLNGTTEKVDETISEPADGN